MNDPYDKFTEKGVGIGQSTAYVLDTYGVPDDASGGLYFAYISQGLVFYYDKNKINRILIIEPEDEAQSKREKTIIENIIKQNIPK